MTIRRNPHRTRYITWVDIGLFRDTTKPMPQPASDSGFARIEAPSDQPHFRLDLPPGFNFNTSIAVNEVYTRDPKLTPKAIIYRTKVWLSGGYFVGRVDRMYQWTQDYLQGYEWLIRNNLTNTDEQVGWLDSSSVDLRILCMHSKSWVMFENKWVGHI
jgi:hypothetical protein